MLVKTLYSPDSFSGRVPQADFYKDVHGKCNVAVYRSFYEPQWKSKFETAKVNRCNKTLRGYFYEVTPKDGNEFYKFLLSKGWTE